MYKKDEVLKSLSQFKSSLSRTINVQKMVLFSSYARGENKRWSDVDLLIISPDFRKVRFIKRSLGFYKLWHLDLPVDYLCFTPEEFKRQKKQVSIVSTALKEGIEIA